MRKNIFYGVIILVFSFFSVTKGFANCPDYWTEAYKRQNCPGYGGGGGYARPTYTPPPVYQPSPMELKEKQSVHFNDQGMKAFKRGNYKEAIRFYQTALDLATTAESVRVNRQNIANAHSFLGNAAQKRGDLEEALREVEMALQYDVKKDYSNKKFDWPAWAKGLREEIANKKRELEAEQEHQKKEQEAAIKMRTALEHLSQAINAKDSLSNMPEQRAPSNALPSSNLDFLPAGSAPARVNADVQNNPTDRSTASSNPENKASASLEFMGANNAAPASGQSDHSGMFGTPRTPTILNSEPSDSSGKQTQYSSASAQLQAAATGGKHEEEKGKKNIVAIKKNTDCVMTGGNCPPANSLQFPKPDNYPRPRGGASLNEEHYKALQATPEGKALLEKENKLATELNSAKEVVAKLEKELDTTVNPNTKGKMQVDLVRAREAADRKKSELDVTQIQVEEKAKTIITYKLLGPKSSQDSAPKND